MPAVSNFAIQNTNVVYSALEASPYDLIVTDGAPFVGFRQLTDNQMKELKAQGRLVAGYVSTSVTDTVRYYWQSKWTTGGDKTADLTDEAPYWLRTGVENGFGIVVDFTDSEWRGYVVCQAVELVKRGYNAIFLDDVLSYYQLADHIYLGPEDIIPDAIINPLADSMIALIVAVREAIGSDVYLIVNGDPYIVGNSTHEAAGDEARAFRCAIDAMLLENLGAAATAAAIANLGSETLLAVHDEKKLALDPNFVRYSYDHGIRPYLVRDGDSYGALGTFPQPGTASADMLLGGDGPNLLRGLDGDDRITGGGGADTLDGGPGADTAVFSGALNDYSRATNGAVTTVQDLRPGADGGDSLSAIEILRFADQSVIVGPVTTRSALNIAFANALRVDPATQANGAYISGLEAAVAGGATLASAIQQIVDRADTTASVATLSYQFFIGHTPSGPGMDYLVSPTGPNPSNINSADYQGFNLENRYINFAVNLGKVGEGRAAFETAYGAKSLLEATRSAYQKIFGEAPSDAKLHALLDPTFEVNGVMLTRAEYFAVYGQDGLSGIGTKAAMVGWLLAEAAKADIGMFALANEAFLTDLADGAPFQVDLVGVYGRPEFNFHPG